MFVVSVAASVPAWRPLLTTLVASSKPHRDCPAFEIVIVIGYVFPGTYSVGTPDIKKVPPAAFRELPEWQSVQFGWPKSPVVPSGGPPEKASRSPAVQART